MAFRGNEMSAWEDALDWLGLPRGGRPKVDKQAWVVLEWERGHAEPQKARRSRQQATAAEHRNLLHRLHSGRRKEGAVWELTPS